MRPEWWQFGVLLLASTLLHLFLLILQNRAVQRGGAEIRLAAYWAPPPLSAVSLGPLPDLLHWQPQATLWVEVQVTRERMMARSKSGVADDLTGFQKGMVRDEVEAGVMAELGCRGLVPRVARLDRAGAERPRPGDYLLEVMMYSTCSAFAPCKTWYQAGLYEVSSRQHLMQDGPPNRNYTRFHPPCAAYLLEILAAEGSAVRVAREPVLEASALGLRGLIGRTADKAAQAIERYERGEREGFPSVRACCFCQ